MCTYIDDLCPGSEMVKHFFLLSPQLGVPYLLMLLESLNQEDEVYGACNTHGRNRYKMPEEIIWITCM
jgi:hypothetical protein